MSKMPPFLLNSEISSGNIHERPYQCLGVGGVSPLKKNLNQQKLNKTNAAFIPAETMTGRTLPSESDAAGTVPPAARQATLTPKTIGNPDVCVAMRPFRKLTFREFPPTPIARAINNQHHTYYV